MGKTVQLVTLELKPDHRLLIARRDRLRLQAAANRCGVSPRHLNRRLVQATGFSYLEFLNRYRLRKALRKMQKGDLTLLEISHAAGFGSLSGFQRQFAAILGRSAREVRKELRQG